MKKNKNQLKLSICTCIACLIKKKPYWLFKLIDARKEINYINLSFNMLIKYSFFKFKHSWMRVFVPLMVILSISISTLTIFSLTLLLLKSLLQILQ